MNNKMTQENQIKRITLLNQLIAPYLATASIIIAIGVFIMSNTDHLSWQRLVLLIPVIGIVIYIYLTYKKQKREIENIFK